MFNHDKWEQISIAIKFPTVYGWQFTSMLMVLLQSREYTAVELMELYSVSEMCVLFVQAVQ